MNTPIADFVRGYEKKNMTRLHMPGHKGKSFLGCEQWDITEIGGADALYEATGIIAESEANASKLFGTARTVYSTEGSSQCIRAMLYLAMTNRKSNGRPTVVAARNVHKAFIYAAAVLDLDVVWLWPEEDVQSICSCPISAEQLTETLKSLKEPPIAVYITSPDYLGGQPDISALAKVCHERDTILAVDNAHGAYLHFLEELMHPIDLGADITCDSAHKTLPVLTGGAYLQISKNAPKGFVENAKHAMALFGSTSPSYLILASLDLCNEYLVENYRDKLATTTRKLEEVRETLRQAGWKVLMTEPLKLTICAPQGLSGIDLAETLREQNIECEYADEKYMVCMVTPENTEEDLGRLLMALGKNELPYMAEKPIGQVRCRQSMTMREAIFAEQETISAQDALGRVCGTPTVSCPPAIPIVVSGEVIEQQAIDVFKRYGITKIDVVNDK